MPRVLVLAIGNPLRSDDGLAWHAADELTPVVSSSEIEIKKVHQLTLELSEDVSRAALVIFVDATESGHPGVLNCAQVMASAGESASSHHLTPDALLQLAATLYHARPNGFLVSLTGKCFDHGESLSLEIREAIPLLVEKIRELIRTGEC
jgi:hydrogenase maturation protease